MGIRTTGTEPAIVLYDSVTGYPLQTEVFTTEEEAEGFLEFAGRFEYVALSQQTSAELVELRERARKWNQGERLVEQLRALANPEHDDSPLAMELAGYAAGAAATQLIDNWSDALAGGENLGRLVPDIDQVIMQLSHFRAAVNSLLLHRYVEQSTDQEERVTYEGRVPYANSMADTAAGAGSN